MRSVLPDKRVFTQDPKDPAFIQNPYALYEKFHAVGGPIFWSNYHTWCLAGFDDVYRTLQDKRFKRLKPAETQTNDSKPHLADFNRVEQFSLLGLEAPEHTRIRKRINAAFMSRKVLQMRDTISATAESLIDQFEPQGSVELLQHYATPLPLSIITKLLGVPISAGAHLLAWSHAMVRVYTMTQTHDDEQQANQAAAEFEAFLFEQIALRRERAGDDLLSALVNDTDNNALSDAEIVSTCVLLLNAGHEATVHQIGNAVRTLLQQVDNPADCFHDDATSDATVSELLRYDAPLHLFLRYAHEDIQLHPDVTLARGEPVALLLGAANRDPSRFSHANQFNPAR
ncbi:MAG: cytochrome P450, partial [Gammaproteobacteria bacterium]|nr:cytochrome P450 [Gammaproteobacteria bacterium]